MKMFCPRRERLGFSINGNKPIASPVAGLLCSCCPLHVAWLIAFVVVDAVKCVCFGWSLSNVSGKSFKRKSPSLTYRNAATAVIWICRAIGIEASLFDLGPCSMKVCPTEPVFLSDFTYGVSLKASATLCRSTTSDLGCRQYLGPAAFAATEPKPALVDGGMIVFDGESSASIAD